MYRVTLILLPLFLLCCKQDASETANRSIEDIYFSDYVSPRLKWGFIDTTGRKAIKAKYDDLKDFSNGLAASSLNGKWGYLDLQGNVAIKHNYKQAYSFIRNHSFVQDFDNKILLINSKGNIIDTVNCQSFKNFTFDYACIFDANGWTAIDTTGTILFESRYFSLQELDADHLIAKGIDGYGVINTEGDTLLALNHQMIYADTGHSIRVKKDDLYHYISKSDWKTKSTAFKKTFSFNKNYAVTKNLQDEYLVINNSYEVLHRLNHDEIIPISEQKLAYKEGKSWGLINLDGSRVTDARYNYFHKEQERRIVYALGDYFGYLDQNGNKINNSLYPLAWDFVNGYARVIDQGGIGFIRLDGQIHIKPQFREVMDFHNGLARYQEIN